MTSFANAFASPDNSPSEQFSNVDLDQQTTTTTTTTPTTEGNASDQQQEQAHSSYVSLTDAATFHTDPVARVSPTSLQEFPSTNPIDRRISMPDMTKISASSAAAVAAVAPTIDKFKQWSRSAYKCTKQTIFEKLGKTTRTVDVELENQIEQLRETKRRYENLLALARSYANHFANLLQTQRALSDTFLELKHKSFHLCDEYGYNAETQNLLVRHGETLMQALNFFISTLNTLCHKTIEDTINTIRLYEVSRLEYDACRTEMEMLPIGSQLTEKQREFEKCKEKYEKFKCDVGIKMQFLDENQTKVMKKQLLLFHNAIAAYFSGNHDALAATMKQFNLKVMSNGDHSSDKAHPSQQQQSFLEQPFH